MKVVVENTLSSIKALVLVAEGVSNAPSPEALNDELRTLVARIAALDEGAWPTPETKHAVREMLRTSAFKPTGRNKPASEYLAQVARDGRFPFISTLVDINNLVSLEAGVPASILDGTRFLCDQSTAGSYQLTLRTGQPDERYVFNHTGQAIELEGLALACNAAGVPLGNAIKDSMLGKVTPDTKSILAIVWLPASWTEKQAQQTGDRFASLLVQHAGAKTTSITIA